MTGFDIGVLVIVAVGAAFGLARGFVAEVLSLLAWVAGLVAIRYAHGPLTAALEGTVGTHSGASVLAFALLLFAPYLAVRLLARWAGGVSRGSVLGPIDRVLGLGFGALKMTIIVVLAFSVAMLGYDTVWGAAGRPDWVTASRTYPFVNAASNELVTLLAKRRHDAQMAERADAAHSAATPAP